MLCYLINVSGLRTLIYCLEPFNKMDRNSKMFKNDILNKLFKYFLQKVYF